MTVLWVMEPEVALIVTCEVPAGVDGTKTSLLLEQPAMAIKPAETTRTPNRPRSRMERSLLRDRRLVKVRIAPKGRKRTAAIPAVLAPRKVGGRKSAIFFTVAIVTVLVAGAPEATVKLAGEKVQVAASGRPLQASATVPLKLLVGTALTTAVAEEPAATVAAEVEALKP